MSIRGLNIGCGADIKAGCVNVDRVALPGVTVVCDLGRLPYPFRADSFDDIWAISVLEHLPSTVAAVEELFRVARPGARVHIRVPYWNSADVAADPTHLRGYSERTFRFFDPDTDEFRKRGYYSRARFHIESITPYVLVRGYRRVESPLAARLALRAARYFSNVVHHLDVELIALKPRA